MQWLPLHYLVLYCIRKGTHEVRTVGCTTLIFLCTCFWWVAIFLQWNGNTKAIQKVSTSFLPTAGASYTSNSWEHWMSWTDTWNHCSRFLLMWCVSCIQTVNMVPLLVICIKSCGLFFMGGECDRGWNSEAFFYSVMGRGRLCQGVLMLHTNAYSYCAAHTRETL